jgi:hypothetical protein
LKVYRHVDRVLETPRGHPWGTAIDNPDERYYDFKEHSDLIPEVLEDFKPWSRYPAIATSYELLRWINGPESVVESNDCAFQEIPRRPVDVPDGLLFVGRMLEHRGGSGAPGRGFSRAPSR